MSNSWRTLRIDIPSASSLHSKKSLDSPTASTQTIASFNNSSKQQIGTAKCAKRQIKSAKQSIIGRETLQNQKDRTKDLHPSIKVMIENASTTERDKAGELGENFLSL